MDTERNYYKRLFARAWHETANIWTSYRWWISAATPIAAVCLLIERQGWRSIMNASDVLINAVGGAVIAFAGSLFISLFRAPKMLDADRASEIDVLQLRNASLSDELVTARTQLTKPPEVSKWEQKQRKLVAEKLAAFSSYEQQVIQHILQHGQIDRAGLINSGIADIKIIDSAVQKGKQASLLQEVGMAYNFSANPNFHLGLNFYFNGE